MAKNNANAKLLAQAPCCIVVCGDSNVEGIHDFLIQGCSAATQNMLLAVHALGLGGVWCGVLRGKEWSRQIAQVLSLPIKIEPMAVVALGYPAEQKEPIERYSETHIHFEHWQSSNKGGIA